MFRQFSVPFVWLFIVSFIAISPFIVISPSSADEPSSKPVTNSSKLKWHSDISKALATAKSQKTVTLILFTGKGWCPYCTKLEKSILHSKEFKTLVKTKKLVLLELNFPLDDSKVPAKDLMPKKKMAEKYSITAFPSIVFLNSEGKVLGRQSYMRDKTKWFKKTNEILKEKTQ